MGTSSKSPSYLVRSAHGIWYFRLIVPPYAQHRVGRKVIKRSLRTRSKREAILKASSLLLESMAMIGRSDCSEALSCSVSDISYSKPRSDSLQTTLSSKNDVPLHQSDENRLSEVFYSFRNLQELEGISIKTLDDKQAVVNLLILVVGDLNVSDYSNKDINEFRDTVLQLPPLAMRTIKQNPSIKLSDLMESKSKKISITTYNNYIKNISTIFEYALSQGMICKNPFSSAKIKQKRKQSSYRDVFSKDDLDKIFGEILLCESWKFWIPLLGYYGAFRLNEICQLYKNDVKFVNSIPCIHVQETMPDQKIKTISSERLVPIHNDLINLGFLDFVNKIDNNTRLFDLRWTDKHGYSATPSKWFSRLRKKVDINDCGNGHKDFHSFRHTVANMLKQKGVSENEIGGLLGHATGGITNNRYGKDYDPKFLLSSLHKIDSVV